MSRIQAVMLSALLVLIPFVASCQEKGDPDKKGVPTGGKDPAPKKELTREQLIKTIEKDFVQARQKAYGAMQAAKTPDDEKAAQKLP